MSEEFQEGDIVRLRPATHAEAESCDLSREYWMASCGKYRARDSASGK